MTQSVSESGQTWCTVGWAFRKADSQSMEAGYFLRCALEINSWGKEGKEERMGRRRSRAVTWAQQQLQLTHKQLESQNGPSELSSARLKWLELDISAPSTGSEPPQKVIRDTAFGSCGSLHLRQSPKRQSAQGCHPQDSEQLGQQGLH